MKSKTADDLLPCACNRDDSHSCTRVRGPPVALHVSQQISSQSWGFSGVAAVSRYTPLKRPCCTCRSSTPGVSHVKLPLKRCRATRGCSSYTCGCRATLCNYGSPKPSRALSKGLIAKCIAAPIAALTDPDAPTPKEVCFQQTFKPT